MNQNHLKVFVSAATRGIGFSIASRFVQDGHDVAICGRDPGRVEFARKNLSDLNRSSKIYAYVADLANKEQHADLLNKLEQDGFCPDIYVCNTGQPANTCLSRLDRDQWDHDMELVIGQAVFAVQKFAPKMAENGYGRIIFISSTYAKSPTRNFLVGSIARGGLYVLSKALVDEYSSRGVASFVVGLGFVDTPLLRNMALGREFDSFDPASTSNAELWSDKYAEWAEAIPAKRIGSAEELAEVVRFLASPAASYLNGNVLSFSGGLDRVIL